MIARGTITFEFNLDEDPLFEMFSEEATLEEKLDYFRETMAQDLVQMSYQGEDLYNCIEMEIVE
jgi:hypothetical protein